jgi:hypothetical protein
MELLYAEEQFLMAQVFRVWLMGDEGEGAARLQNALIYF